MPIVVKYGNPSAAIGAGGAVGQYRHNMRTSQMLQRQLMEEEHMKRISEERAKDRRARVKMNKMGIDARLEMNEMDIEAAYGMQQFEFEQGSIMADETFTEEQKVGLSKLAHARQIAATRFRNDPGLLQRFSEEIQARERAIYEQPRPKPKTIQEQIEGRISTFDFNGTKIPMTVDSKGNVIAVPNAHQYLAPDDPFGNTGTSGGLSTPQKQAPKAPAEEKPKTQAEKQKEYEDQAKDIIGLIED